MAASSARSLLPREHGAYGQLALPLLTALLSGQPTAAAYLYAAAAVFAFCAHEPLLVLLGHRGSRALREAGSRARIRLILLAAFTLLSAGLALLLSEAAARLSFLAPLGGAFPMGLLIWQKQERTDWGEIAAAGALSASALPVMIAGGLPAQLAWSAWGAWSIGFALVTLSLRWAIHGRKKALRCTISSVAFLPLLLVPFWLVLQASIAVAVAVIPTSGVAIGLFIMPPSPQRLHRIGWLLVMSSVTTGLLLVRAARSTGL